MYPKSNFTKGSFPNQLDKLVVIYTCDWYFWSHLQGKVFDVSYQLLLILLHLLDLNLRLSSSSEVWIRERLYGSDIVVLKVISIRDKVSGCPSVIWFARLIGLHHYGV